MAGRQPSRPSTAANVHTRRNLFEGGALRRPTSSSTTTITTTATSATLLELPLNSDECEIVVRKPDGNLTSVIPTITPTDNEIVVEDEDEDSEARLADLLKNRRQSNEPELFDLLSANLRRKVSSLQANKWIYEQDDRKF